MRFLQHMVHHWDMGLTYTLDFYNYNTLISLLQSSTHSTLTSTRVMIVVLNLMTWQNSDTGCMMLPGRNMLYALFYNSPHVALMSYLCKFDINPSLFGNQDVQRLYIYNIYMYNIYKFDYSSVHFENITKPAKLLKWNQCVCTQHVVFA